MSSHNTRSFLDQDDFDTPLEQELHTLHEATKQGNLPQEIVNSIHRLCDYVNKHDKYANKITTPVSDELTSLLDRSHSHPWNQLYKDGKISQPLQVHWLSDIIQVQLLQFMIKMQGAKEILEIGMFTGYASLGMAESIPAGGRVVTCDIEPYLQTFARESFDKSPHGNKIDIRIGDAKNTLLELLKAGATFDFVYIDAKQSAYLEYFDILFKQGLLAKGGTVAVDNTFGYGEVITGKGDSLADKFNEMVAKDNTVEQVFLPIRDGMLFIRRK